MMAIFAWKVAVSNKKVEFEAVQIKITKFFDKISGWRLND